MISKENQVQWLQEIVASIRALEKKDEWKVYLGVACLSIVLSLLLVLTSVFFRVDQNSQIEDKKPVSHLNLTDGDFTAQAVQDIVSRAAAPAVQAEKQQVAGRIEQVVESGGDWYYDEVHKDWRYKK